MQALLNLTRQLCEYPRCVVKGVTFGRHDRIGVPADPLMAATALEEKDRGETCLTSLLCLGNNREPLCLSLDLVIPNDKGSRSAWESCYIGLAGPLQ